MTPNEVWEFLQQSDNRGRGGNAGTALLTESGEDLLTEAGLQIFTES